MQISHKPPRELSKNVRGWVLPVAIVLVWWLALHVGWVTSPLLVSPVAVWNRAVVQISSGALWDALSASLYRCLWGFVIGTLAGLIFGALLGFSRWVDRSVGPSFHALKQISLFAWIPLLSVWFGLSDVTKIAFVSMAAFFPVVLNTYEGIRSVPRELIEVARVYQFSAWQLWCRVILPGAAPSLFTGIHLALIYSWLATLGAESLLVSGKGMANILIDGRENLWMDQILFGVLVIGLVGALLNWLLGVLEKRWLAWHTQTVAHYGI